MFCPIYFDSKILRFKNHPSLPMKLGTPPRTFLQRFFLAVVQHSTQLPPRRTPPCFSYFPTIVMEQEKSGIARTLVETHPVPLEDVTAAHDEVRTGPGRLLDGVVRKTAINLDVEVRVPSSQLPHFRHLSRPQLTRRRSTDVLQL